MKNATIIHQILAPQCFPRIKNRFLQRNSSCESENFTSRFFIGEGFGDHAPRPAVMLRNEEVASREWWWRQMDEADGP